MKLGKRPFEKFVKTAELLYGSAENKSKKGRLPVQTNDDVAGKATTFDKGWLI